MTARRTTMVEVGSARLAAHEAGPVDAPGTLLLTHGFPLTHAMWDAQLDGLSDRWRVVAPDLRGYGGSTLGDWADASASPSLERYADDLRAIIDAIRPPRPLVLVGFSMGGYVALRVAASPSPWFDALVLMNTRAAADTEDARATRLKMAAGVGQWGAARVAELMRPKLFAPGTPEERVAPVVAAISSADPRAIAASQLAMAARPDSTPLLPRVTAPTLVVVGEEDALSPPAEMRGMAEATPGARYVEVAGAGHMAPVERPEAVNAALADFAGSLAE